MRILFLALDVRLEVPRGDAVHVVEVVRALGTRGHHLTVVTATPEGAVPDLGPNAVHHRRAEGSDWKVVLRCLRLARGNAADVVYERRLSPKIAFAVSMLARLPFVVEVNGIEDEAQMLGHPTARRWPTIRRAIRRQMYRRAARVVTVSERLSNQVRREQRLEHGRVVTVPNGVDTDRFVPIDSTSARTELGMVGGPWIVYVGNLVPWQGVETLLKSMAHPAMTLDARLAVVGDGASRPLLEETARRLEIHNRVTFFGAVPHEQVPIHVSASDVCVAPFTRYRNEAIGPSPLKLYEYMACGKPVVASDIPGVRDVLVSSGGGVVVPPDDPPSLSRATAELLSSPTKARAMGAKGRLYVLAEATWLKTAERLEGVLVETRDQMP